MHSQLQYVQQLSFLCSQALNFLTNNLLLLWNESHCFTIPNTKVIRQIPFDSFHILQVPQQQKKEEKHSKFEVNSLGGGSGNSWQAKENVNTIAAHVDKDNTFNAYMIKNKTG